MYYSTLFAKEDKRPVLWGLASLAAELRDIPRQASEPQLAAIKLAWWKTELIQHGKVKGNHPISLCIGSDTLGKTPDELIENLCQSASDVMQFPSFFTNADWERHCLQVSGGLFYMAALDLGVQEKAQLEKIQQWGGSSQQLTHLLTIGKSLSRGWHPFPVDVLQQHGVSVEALRARRPSAQFDAMMQALGQQITDRGETAWRQLNADTRQTLKPLRALWRMRQKEWKLTRQNTNALLTQGTRLTPLKKLSMAWTTQALGW